MNERLSRRCLDITLDLCRRPINTIFQNLPDGTGLALVRQRLESGEYTSPAAWYEAVCEVFERELNRHPPGSPTHSAAAYGLKEVHRLSQGLSFRDPQSWYELVRRKMRKLSGVISESPVCQGVDPFIISLVARAIACPSPSPRNLPDIAARASELLADARARHDAVCLLKEADPSVEVDGDRIRVDLERLRTCAADALLRYLEYRETAASDRSDTSPRPV